MVNTGIKIGVIIVCALLFRLGGATFKMARRAIMPFILALTCAILTKCWWEFLAVGVGLQTMMLGYGEDSPLYKAFGSWGARGAWGLLVALGASIGLVLGHFIGLPIALYLAYNFAIGALLCKWEAPDWVIEPCMGIGIASVVLFL